MDFPTLTAAKASARSCDGDYIRTYGYAALGDDGMGLYRQIDRLMPCGFQSAADHSFWFPFGPLTAIMLGLDLTGASDCAPALNAAFALMTATNNYHLEFQNGNASFLTAISALDSSFNLVARNRGGTTWSVNFDAPDNSCFIYYNGTGILMDGFFFQAGDAAHPNVRIGYMVELASSMLSTAGGYSGMTHCVFTGNGTMQAALLVDGSGRSTGPAPGDRDIHFDDIRIFQCRDWHAIVRSGKGSVFENFTCVNTPAAPRFGSVLLTGIPGNTSDGVKMGFTQTPAGVRIEHATGCRIEAGNACQSRLEIASTAVGCEISAVNVAPGNIVNKSTTSMIRTSQGDFPYQP